MRRSRHPRKAVAVCFGRRLEIEHAFGDDAKAPRGADEDLLPVDAGIVLAQVRAEVEHRARFVPARTTFQTQHVAAPRRHI